MDLPPPPWFQDRAPRRPTAPQWRYPFHLLTPYESVFVAHHGGLGTMAARALLAYRKFLADEHGTAGRFELTRLTVGTVGGVRITRIG